MATDGWQKHEKFGYYFKFDGNYDGDETGNEWKTGWMILADVEHLGMFAISYGDPINAYGDVHCALFPSEEDAMYAVDHNKINF